MKILYIITGLGLGGAEKVVCDLADQMVSKGHIVKIAYLTGEAVVRPKSDNIEVIYLALNSLQSIVSASLKYRHLIRQFKPDVVHAHMIHANIFTRLNRLGAKTPKLVTSAHSNNEGGLLRMFAYRVTNNLADVTTNVSQRACDEFVTKKAVLKNQILTMYNGIDLSQYTMNDKNFEDRTADSIAVGRFHDAKDYPNLIQAYTIFINGTIKKDVKLSIVGLQDKTIFPLIKNQVDESALNNNIKFLGVRNDIPKLLNSSKFFISSSKYEGLPTVVIEAMACGCFVIATDCGGAAEIMGDTGILVPPQDSQALAKAIQKASALTHEQIRQNNLKARRRVEELFSLEKSVSNWLKIYESK